MPCIDKFSKIQKQQKRQQKQQKAKKSRKKYCSIKLNHQDVHDYIIEHNPKILLEKVSIPEEIHSPTPEVQVNLCQKLLFLHQLTQNMTKDHRFKVHMF